MAWTETLRALLRRAREDDEAEGLRYLSRAELRHLSDEELLELHKRCHERFRGLEGNVE